MPAARIATVRRKTKETDIAVTVNLDGNGTARIATGLGFLDHMLDLFARHGYFDITIAARGDLDVDAHHTVEDLGIVLGEAFAKALGEKKSITRFGFFTLPMEDSLATVAADLSGRPFLAYRVTYPTSKTGKFETGLVKEFLAAFANNARMNLHVTVPYGDNSHHIAEAIFKAAGRSLEAATRRNPREKGVPSTKGKL